MRSGRRVFLSLLVVTGTVIQAVGQEARPKRDPDVPYVPTREEVVAGMLKLGGVKAGDVVYDLGCGDGRIVITAAQKYGTRGIGIDINPQRIREAEENAKRSGVTDKVKFIEQDLFEAKISDATVVMLYLLPSVNLKLRPKLLSDLKPGTRIVSHSFDMGDWKPEKEIEVDGERIYFWTIPASRSITK
jgi:precorrin-6B methylase 2